MMNYIFNINIQHCSVLIVCWRTQTFVLNFHIDEINLFLMIVGRTTHNVNIPELPMKITEQSWNFVHCRFINSIKHFVRTLKNKLISWHKQRSCIVYLSVVRSIVNILWRHILCQCNNVLNVIIQLLTGFEDNSKFVWPKNGFVARSRRPRAPDPFE